MVANEGFVTLLPGFMLHLCKHLSVKALPIDLPIERRPMAVVTLKNRTLSPVVQRFIDCIHAVAGPLAKGKLTGAIKGTSKPNGRRAVR
jgi:DNA-binding transcriptional LysR family regulator